MCNPGIQVIVDGQAAETAGRFRDKYERYECGILLLLAHRSAELLNAAPGTSQSQKNTLARSAVTFNRHNIQRRP
jgi:hypothetical protein